MPALDSSVARFLEAACVPLDAAHGSGSLAEAAALLAAHPDLARANIHVAAVLGDAPRVREHLAADPQAATARGGPREWDALTHLCFSRFLRLAPEKSDEFVQAATCLLDAGADPNTGWFERDHLPEPMWESALYGAAGVAHHAGLTRLLLERGADPNDDEVPYHAPESRDNAVVELLVGSGRLTEDSLATMLLRKADVHDGDGLRWLLQHGADPNRRTRWNRTALHQAVLRDNALATIECLLDHGGDPSAVSDQPGTDASPDGRTGTALAAARGRDDILDCLARRGLPHGLRGIGLLLAACARDDGPTLQQLLEQRSVRVDDLRAHAGRWLGLFSGNGNTKGVRRLLDLGLPVNARWTEGDAYFGTPRDSTALHVAAWRARPGTVALLVERGADVHARDGCGHTPLFLAVRATVDSYWSARRSPESVATLLRAGASPVDIPYPCGYAEVDALLAAAKA